MRKVKQEHPHLKASLSLDAVLLVKRCWFCEGQVGFDSHARKNELGIRSLVGISRVIGTTRPKAN